MHSLGELVTLQLLTNKHDPHKKEASEFIREIRTLMNGEGGGRIHTHTHEGSWDIYSS